MTYKEEIRFNSLELRVVELEQARLTQGDTQEAHDEEGQPSNLDNIDSVRDSGVSGSGVDALMVERAERAEAELEVKQLALNCAYRYNDEDKATITALKAERDAMQACVDACRQILNTHIFARPSSCELAREAIAKLDAQKEAQ